MRLRESNRNLFKKRRPMNIKGLLLWGALAFCLLALASWAIAPAGL